MTRFLGQLIAGLVFAVFGFLSGVILVGCGEVAYTAARSVLDAHPYAVLACAVVGAAFGFSRRD